MSLSDFFSSARGPGLVGLVLAMVVLLGFILLGTLTLDERFQGGGLTMSSKIAGNDREISQLHGQLEAMNQRLAAVGDREQAAENMQRIKSELQRLRQSITTKRAAVAEHREAMIEEEQKFRDYRDKYKSMIRDAAAGTVIETLQTKSGTVYHDVRVKKVGSLGMDIMHRSGSCRVAVEDLPTDIQKYYQFEEGEAQATRQQEEDQRMQHSLATAAVLRSKQQQQAADQAARAREEAANRERTLRYLATSLTEIDQAIIKLEYDINLESTKNISRAPQMRQQLAGLKQQKRDMEVRRRQLMASPE